MSWIENADIVLGDMIIFQYAGRLRIEEVVDILPDPNCIKVRLEGGPFFLPRDQVFLVPTKGCHALTATSESTASIGDDMLGKPLSGQHVVVGLDGMGNICLCAALGGLCEDLETVYRVPRCIEELDTVREV